MLRLWRRLTACLRRSLDHTKRAALLLMAGARRPPPALSPAPATSPAPAHSPAPAPAPAPAISPATVPKRRSKRSVSASDANISQHSLSSNVTAVLEHYSSPILGNPKKSALKQPSARESTRKMESIKFDLSNLEQFNRSSDVVLINETKDLSDLSDDITLHYSDTSTQSSPRRSNSRSSKILEKLGRSISQTTIQETVTPEMSKRKSMRGSLILKRALENSHMTPHSEQSYSSTLTSIRKSPRSTNLESYSVVDLVSLDSNDTSSSVYDSVQSSNVIFAASPTLARRSKSVGSMKASTPYKARSITPNRAVSEKRRTRSSAALITPENTQQLLPLNSTKVRKPSKSRINDSDLLLLDEEDESPRSSRKKPRAISPVHKNISISASYLEMPEGGTVTPENRQSPEEIVTPMLNVQSLVDQSLSRNSSGIRRQVKPNRKRKTIGVIRSVKSRASARSRSLNISRLKKSSDENEKIVTPKSSVKLMQEGVKNKHSSARKSYSKRSIIDNLASSNVVKELFTNPVKRKLSQSMTEFSRNQLFNDDEVSILSNVNNASLTEKTPENSLFTHSEALAHELFVSPLSSPSNSPSLSHLKYLYSNNSPENLPTRGSKTLLSTSRTRKSVQNDLTNVSGVKNVFAKSPRNRLSDVRVKELFVTEPYNDLTQVTGISTLFQTKKGRSPTAISPKLTGVRCLYKKKSPRNDLRNVSGVKSALQIRSPKNDLTNVMQIKQLFTTNKSAGLSDVSGVEELFNESENLDTTFDKLVGRPPIKSYVRSKSHILTKKKKSTRNAKSLHDSVDLITDNVEGWLQNEFNKLVHKQAASKSSNKSDSNLSRELRKLTTDTVDGEIPSLSLGRMRNSTIINNTEISNAKSASELYSARKLPIKKRSVVNASAEQREPRSLSKSRRLPLKKRLVSHSTPVKAGAHLSMNSTELGRVSPIAPAAAPAPAPSPAAASAFASAPAASPASGRCNSSWSRIGRTDLGHYHTPAEDYRKTSKTLHEVIPGKKTRSMKAIDDVTAIIEPVMISLKKTRSKSKPVTPVQRATRGRRAVVSKSKSRVSLIIPKKPPTLSPKPHKVSETRAPARTRARQNNVEEKMKTPKKTRGKAKVAASSPSPRRPRRAAPQPAAAQPAIQTKKTRGKAKQSQTEAVEERPLNNVTVESVRRGRRAPTRKQEVLVPEVPLKRGRKNNVAAEHVSAKRKTQNNTNLNEAKPNTRAKPKLEIENEAKPVGKRQTKSRVQDQKKTEMSPIQSEAKRQTKSKSKLNEEASKIQSESVQTVGTGRGRRGKAVAAALEAPVEITSRRRRAKLNDESEKYNESLVKRGRNTQNKPVNTNEGSKLVKNTRNAKKQIADQTASPAAGIASGIRNRKRKSNTQEGLTMAPAKRRRAAAGAGAGAEAAEGAATGAAAAAETRSRRRR